MDRQDIDALLIGALYGELTPADEARLAAHLESHPADKTALDDLKSARARVVESRIFELQTEPPQAISAVLLQEAARRAPKKVAVGEPRDSWFHRFVRSFAAHPAMAAAAMLVLVVGIAGTIYMKNGSVGVEKTVDQSEDTRGAVATNAPATPPADPNANVAKDQPAAGSAAAYQVGLAEGQLDRKEAADTEKAAERQQADAKAERAKLAQTQTTTPAPKADTAVAYEPKPAAHAASKSKKGTGYLEVETPQPQPKEMDSGGDKLADGETFSGIASAGGGGAGQKQAGPSNKFASPPVGNAAPGGAAAGAPAPAAQEPPPQVAATPPPPPADIAKNVPKAPATKPAPPPSKTVAKPAQEAPVEATRGDTDLIAWAKQQHAAAVAQVKAGNCSAAAQTAVSVRNRAFGYYQQNMANDRELKGCASYIADAVNRDEERSSKPKAAKSRASDEAPAPAQSK